MEISQSEIEAAKRVQARAEEIALRWVKSWGRFAGYRSVRNVQIDFVKNEIRFYAVPAVSGIQFYQVIKLDYLFDESTLERDSQESYRQRLEQSANKLRRVHELKQTDQVKEYLDLMLSARISQPYDFCNSPNI